MDALLDARVFALAHERLAPLQLSLWGWGGMSLGVPSIDLHAVPEWLLHHSKCPVIPRTTNARSRKVFHVPSDRPGKRDISVEWHDPQELYSEQVCPTVNTDD